MRATVASPRGSGPRALLPRALLMVIVALSSACSGSDGQAGADGTSMLLRAVDVPSDGHCPGGGVRVDTGVDDDRDALLDDAEVDFTSFVCDGADGVNARATLEQPGANCPHGGVMLTLGSAAPTYLCDGAPGADGQDGTNGQSAIATPEAPGVHCAYGGQRLQLGAGTPSYVCNGAPGAIGQAGQSVAMTPEQPGANCASGGQRLQVGTGAATYLCNGVPGADGQDGLSVTMIPEPPGPNCAFGGVALRVGTGPEAYLCSGAPAGTTQPAVETGGVMERYTEAVVEGRIMRDGNEMILSRGIVLATHSDPSLRDTVCFAEAGWGDFAARCEGLTPGTTYHVRAFATNAVGTGYGGVLSFTTKALTVPAVTTQVVSNVTNASAISGGSIPDDGGTPVLARGVCWSPAPEPTLGDACAAEGEGTAGFVVLMTGLGAGTTYHVRAYATNAQGTSYGDDRSFTTVVLPLASVVTGAPSAVAYTTATGGGTVSSENGAPVSSRGLCWATTPAPTIADGIHAEAGGQGSFTAAITGLAAGTTYYLRAFAVNGGGTSYGNEVTFTTLAPSLATLTTKAVGGISSYLAGSGGVIGTDGGSPITAKGVCWSLNPNPTVANSRSLDGAGPASFNSTLTGLSPLTTYHVRAYATNALGTAYGDQLTFTTTDLVTPGPGVPIVGTSTSVITGSSTASSGGYVSSDGGSPVTARGVCWGTSANPTLADSCSTDGGAGVGFFASTLSGLSGCDVVYYVRAYATNATGTGYGSQNTVSTGLLPVVTTAPVTGIGFHDATGGGAVTDDGGCAIAQRGVVWSWMPAPTTSSASTAEGGGVGPFSSLLTGLYANRTYYVRAYARNSVGTSYGAQEVFSTAEPSTPYLGQNHAGGIVFHLDETGEHGLVAAPADQGSHPWGCQGTSIPTSAALGEGPTNTATIVASCGEANSAARTADDLMLNGYDDWFLPSRDELALVRQNLQSQGLGGLYGGLYWSSTAADASRAWVLDLDRNNWMSWQKYDARPVRAIRAF